MAAVDEAALIALACTGDLLATHRLLVHHHAALALYIQRRLPARLASRLSADDLCQEVYVVAIKKLPEFQDRGTGSFLGWLSAVADHKLTDAVRAADAAKRGGGRLPLEAAGGAASSVVALLELMAVDSRTPSRSVMRHEWIDRLREALQRLDPEDQRVVRMRHLEGRSVDDVAAAVGRTPGAVRTQCHRALRRLAEELGDAAAFLTRVDHPNKHKPLPHGGAE